MSKTRVRFDMNQGTRVMADRRTRRQRTRAAQEQSALAVWDLEHDVMCDGTCRAGRYCIQHGDLVPGDDLG